MEKTGNQYFSRIFINLLSSKIVKYSLESYNKIEGKLDLERYTVNHYSL